MKVLEVTSCFPPSRGGVETCVYEVSKLLASRGHEVTVVTSSRGKAAACYRERVNNIDVIRYPERFHFFTTPLILRIAFSVLFQKFDVLHVHGMVPTMSDLAILFAKIRRKPVVLTYHNDAVTTVFGKVGQFITKLYSLFALPIVRLADVIVASTYSYAQTSPVLRHCSVRVVPMGVNPEKFPGPRFQSSKSGNVLFVGQLQAYKGVDTLIDAVGILRNEFGKDLHLKVVGEGPCYTSLTEQTFNMGLSDRVSFEGNVSDDLLLELYGESDVLALPSRNRREAFGIVLLEAMASGKPVVASDLPGVRDIVNRGGGFLVRPDNPTELAARLGEVLYDGVYQGLVRRSLNAVNEFTWPVIVTQYEQIFAEIVRKR